MVLEQDSLDGMKPIKLPFLKIFERFFNAFFQAKALPVKLANCNPVCLVCRISLSTCTNMERFCMSFVDCLRDEVNEGV